MCGRATYKLTWEEIVALYRLTLGTAPHNFQPRFNVCPTTKIDAVIEQDGKRILERMRWGLFGDVQRARRNGRGKTDVPIGVQTDALPHSRVGLL